MSRRRSRGRRSSGRRSDGGSPTRLSLSTRSPATISQKTVSTLNRRDLAKLPARQRTKLMKDVLKDVYPETKFSVKSEIGTQHRSVDVNWVDGSTEKEVQPITKHFMSQYALEDSSYYNDYWFLKRSWSEERKEQIEALIVKTHAMPKGDWEQRQLIERLRWETYVQSSFVGREGQKPTGISYDGARPYLTWDKPPKA